MTEKGKLNVRCQELWHFNIIILTFSTDFTSLMCSGVQTIWKKNRQFREIPVQGVARNYVLRWEAQRRCITANFLGNVFMYQYITVLNATTDQDTEPLSSYPSSAPFSNTNFRSRPTRSHLILRIPSARLTASFSTVKWTQLVRPDPRWAIFTSITTLL
jgi:hypothetical protein